MLNLVKHNNSSRKIIQDGYVLLLVGHSNELMSEDLTQVDGFIIDTNSEVFSLEIITRIRTNYDLKISLLPIFVNGIHHLKKEVLIHTDGLIELSLLSTYIQRMSIIIERVQKIEEPTLITNHVLVQYKTLAYMYSRNIQLTPISTRESFIGYEFPFISLFYKNTEVLSLLKTIEKAVSKNYLSFKLQDYIHLCKSCSGNYLNFRECCPKCKSIDINAHDMIHHFVCAHVAPEKDFKKDDYLECPKCDKNLRHIGIDYDKPSTIYSCNTCSHEFQNPGMLSHCVDCNTENQLEELLQKTIGNYNITQTGENVLFDRSNVSEQNSKSKKQIGNLNIDLFKILLNQEIKRVKTVQCDSFFARISFKNDQLQMLNSSAKNELMIEIGTIIKSYLKESDILSAKKFNNYYLILPETKKHQLERLELIEYNLSKLLSDNLIKEKQKVKISLHKIKSTDKLQDIFS